MKKKLNTEVRRPTGLVFNKEDRPIKDWVTEHDLFKGYRYRQQRITINPKTGKKLVHQPYVSNKDSSDHEFALQYPEWIKIVEIYFNIVAEKLMAGYLYEWPKGMGRLEIVKRRPEQPTMKSGIRFRNMKTMGYSPKLIWRRHFEKGFKYKSYYMFNFSRKRQWSKIAKMLRETPEIIFKLNGS